jgi:hypothetical protein
MSKNLISAPGLLLAAALLLLLAAPSAFAKQKDDRASFGNDITVADGEAAGDIACAFCSVHIHGDVKGDVAVLLGSVTVDSGRGISGDVAVLGGDVNLADDTSIGGNVAIAAGNLNTSPGAIIRGGRTVLRGRFWLLVPLAPLLIFIGLIWLIVYLVRRNRYQFPAYPHGRRV